ncbi:RtcB family protein [Chitinophaga sancti]|uniref:3'-phosphate/5'-hydroxy nucleic acid ligase n=1 Tax=Chitinophaga sancti TaxID=1004 RepID=A0A1K1M7Z7_9BACT|nr:RtcB family protein [Chitinophaga sancti]WQD64566.1 RtcB family protein [Chitinophaga sancti]WQG89809.1 RtcB family protein [Chitinophaga sancti]SFW19290.1 tRNA-splicing ligase RtcB [Chitinophaga sancti]
MQTIAFYCDVQSIEDNAMQQLQQYAQKPYLQGICAFTDIHYCSEKALPVGVAFRTSDYFFPLITGKDIGCGVMYLRISKEDWLKPFNKEEHYRAFSVAHTQMTDDGLGGGNHFLSIEEDDEAVYIICHTGTRDRGIALYQHCIELTRNYSKACGEEVDYVHRDFIDTNFEKYYHDTLQFGYERRKNFCIKTLIFLQNANYIRSNKAAIDRNYLRTNYNGLPQQGALHGTLYVLEDSVHNHLRFNGNEIMHRKGSSELGKDKTVVIPLSMSRGSLLVKAADLQGANNALLSCAHGAGRKLSRFDAMKHWKTVLKEKQRKAYKEQFSELLDRSGNFPHGYIQEFDFAYKESDDILAYQPYLKKVTQTRPVVTVKYTEI